MPRKKEGKEQKEQDLFALLTSIETQLKLMDKRMEVLELQQKLSDTKQAPAAASTAASTHAPTPISSSPSASEDVPKTPDTAPERTALERTNTKPATGGSRANPTEDPARDLTPFGLLRRLSLVA